ncbi:signal peptidase I [Pseudogemmobacter bohemicus]|uniref:signal peptidase I n=1 Tax=Pseudogemmobacter bohemicus TaxID=2250708 RepID=UPI000DD2EC76|nr:signal peptidase I [Pseudogemmobacter bohemicus]
MLRALSPLAVALTLTASPANALCICVKCITGSFRHFTMPSASMEPTLPVGSCFIMQMSRYSAGPPARGAVISYLSPATGEVYIARLIGLPGDQVQMKAGRVWLNGTDVPQVPAPDYILPRDSATAQSQPCGTVEGDNCITTRLTETLPDGQEYQVLNLRDSDGLPDNSDVYDVPEGSVFVLGDNRDNSWDSRFERLDGLSGMVPLANITGTFDSFLRP